MAKQKDRADDGNAVADGVLTDIVEYLLHYEIESDAAFDSARLCLPVHEFVDMFVP